MINRFFLSLWPATCTNIVVLLAKKSCVPACRRRLVVQNYAHETPYAPVENGCVSSAARRGLRAVGQFEIPGGAPRAVACHRVPRHQSLSRREIDSAPYPGAHSGGGPRTELPAEFHGPL